MTDYHDRLTPPPLLIREERELSESETNESPSEAENDLAYLNSDNQSSRNSLSGSEESTRKVSINAVENGDYHSDLTETTDFSDDDSTDSSEPGEKTPSFGYYFPRWPFNFDKENVSQDQLELIKYRYTCGVCDDIVHNNVVLLECKHIFCNCCLQRLTDRCLQCGSKITAAFHDAETESDIKKFFKNMRKEKRLKYEDDFFHHHSFKIYQTSGRLSVWSAVNITNNNSPINSSQDSDETSLDSTDFNIPNDVLPTIKPNVPLNIFQPNLKSLLPFDILKNLSSKGCPVIIWPRDIRLRDSIRKTFFLTVPEESYLGHLAEVVKKFYEKNFSSRYENFNVNLLFTTWRKQSNLVKLQQQRRRKTKYKYELFSSHCMLMATKVTKFLSYDWQIYKIRAFNDIEAGEIIQLTYDLEATRKKNIRNENEEGGCAVDKEEEEKEDQEDEELEEEEDDEEEGDEEMEYELDEEDSQSIDDDENDLDYRE